VKERVRGKKKTRGGSGAATFSVRKATIAVEVAKPYESWTRNDSGP